MLSIKKILCPLDFSEPSFQALLKAIELASLVDAAFTLLHVLPCDATSEPCPQDSRLEAEKYLRGLIWDFIPNHLDVHALVRQGDVTSEILRTAREENVDLIVMATHGSTGWREFALGSVTDEVVRLAPCPVLTINDSALVKEKTPLISASTGSTHSDGSTHGVSDKALRARDV